MWRFAWSWGLVGLLALAPDFGATAHGRDTDASTSHVRVSEPELTGLVQEGIARSATFRSLTQRIDGTDGFVFLRSGACSIGAAAACLMLKVTDVGGARYLHIHVTRQLTRRDHRIAIVGHELQHANEVLSRQWVRNTKDAYALFTRIGSAGSIRSFETDDAQRIEGLIAAELAHRPERSHADDRRTRTRTRTP